MMLMAKEDIFSFKLSTFFFFLFFLYFPLIYFFTTPHSMQDLSSLTRDQRSNLRPLQWKHRVLTTGS